MGQKWPSREEWSKLNTQQQSQYLHNLKPNPGVYINEPTRKVLYEQHLKEEYVNTLQKQGKQMADIAVAGFEQSALPMMKFGLRMASGYLPDKYTGAGVFDQYIALTNQFEKENENKINSDLSAKIVHTAGYLTPILLTMKGSPASLVANVEKGALGAYEVSGLITRAGGLSKWLEATPYGRTIVRAAHGAMDGYLFGTALGETESEKLSDAVTFAKWEALYIPGAGKVAGYAGSAASKFFSKMSSIFGADYVKARMEKTVAQMDKGAPLGAEEHARVKADVTAPEVEWIDLEQHATDPLLVKFNDASKKVLNDTAKELHGEGATYFATKPGKFTTREQKREIVALVQKRMAEAFEFPSAYDAASTAHTIAEDIQRAKQEYPEIAQSISQLEELTQKATGSPIFKGAAEKIQQDTREAAGMGKNLERAPSSVLPRDIAGSKPRYGYGNKLFKIEFKSDIDKALYTVAQETKNKAHDRFMDFLRKTYPDKSDEQIIQMGKDVRARLKSMARDADPKEGPLVFESSAPTQQIPKKPSRLMQKHFPLEETETPPSKGIGPGAAHKADPSFEGDVLMRAISMNEYVEDPIDRLGIEYMKATRGGTAQRTTKMAQMIKDAYEDAIPSAARRQKHQEGLKFHLYMLHVTDHLGQSENVFRSGHYYTGEEGKWTEWQHELYDEYLEVLKRKKKGN